jgi:hypothetical protein
MMVVMMMMMMIVRGMEYKLSTEVLNSTRDRNICVFLLLLLNVLIDSLHFELLSWF